MIRHAFISLRGCPRPFAKGFAGPPAPAPEPPPPPPPAPAAPDVPYGTLTATGTAHNGPARAAGFKLTTGSGPVTLKNGPSATSWPTVLEVTSPVVDEWNLFPGVDPADESTWYPLQNCWAVLGGVGQTVQFAFATYEGSMYALGNLAAELARVTAPYTGSTFYWKAKGPGGSGSGTLGDPWNGVNAMRLGLSSVPDWSIVEFLYTNGPFTIATDGADFPNSTASNSGMSQGSAGDSTSAGPYLGSNKAATSTASRIWFKFDSSQVACDWRTKNNSATNSQRAWAALRIKGEQFVISGFRFYPPNYCWIFDPVTGATRVTGTSGDAEGRSFENMGLMLFGNGNHRIDCHCVGDKTFTRYGFFDGVAGVGVSGATAGLRGSASFCTTVGCLSGDKTGPFGSAGYEFQVPTGFDKHDCVSSDPGWGHSTWLNLSTSGSGNAAGHGNGLSVEGKWFGGCDLYANEISGGYQDGIGAGVCTTLRIAHNYIHDLNTTANRSEWYWRTSGVAVTGQAAPCWDVRTVTNVEGNGIKTGHLNKDRISPTTWLGTDGTASTVTDSLGVAEIRPIVYGNIVHNVGGNGITSNESNGGFVACNEIIDPKGAGILIVGLSKTVANTSRQSNWYFANNFIKKTVTGPSPLSGACIRLETNTNNSPLRIWMHNNIIWAGASQTEIFVPANVTFVENTKNVLVRGAISGTYSQTNNLTDAASKAAAQLYVASVGGDKTLAGLPVGNVLRTAGTPTPQTTARTHGCYTDFRCDPLHTTTPCVGPCLAP